MKDKVKIDHIIDLINGKILVQEKKLSDLIQREWPDSTLINIQKGKLAALNELQREVTLLSYMED